MKSFSMISLLFFAISSGCGVRTVGVSQSHAPEPFGRSRSEDGPYFPPRLYLQGEIVEEKKVFGFHRTDIEKIRTLNLLAIRCDADLTKCERAIAEITALPGFWNRTEGRVVLLAIGFVVGIGATVGVIHVAGDIR